MFARWHAGWGSQDFLRQSGTHFSIPANTRVEIFLAQNFPDELFLYIPANAQVEIVCPLALLDSSSDLSIPANARVESTKVLLTYLFATAFHPRKNAG